MATVLTTGSAADDPSPALLRAATVASRILAGHDADDAGDRAATAWPGAIRVRPPGGSTDWTDAYRNGVNLGDWWAAVLLEGA
jgi:hypothetical protein